MNVLYYSTAFSDSRITYDICYKKFKEAHNFNEIMHKINQTIIIPKT